MRCHRAGIKFAYDKPMIKPHKHAPSFTTSYSRNKLNLQDKFRLFIKQCMLQNGCVRSRFSMHRAIPTVSPEIVDRSFRDLLFGIIIHGASLMVCSTHARERKADAGKRLCSLLYSHGMPYREGRVLSKPVGCR